MVVVGPIIVFLSMFAVLVVIGIAVWIMMSWNIPTVILRYQGDKRRPLLVFTKSRKTTRGGVARLFVRGYRIPLRDFKAENYYPWVKGKKGALILWEPKPGLLTPVLPKRKKMFGKKEHKQVDELRKFVATEAARIGVKDAEFLFSEELYDALLLNAVDDTDIDFLLQEHVRIDSQYSVGWRDFLSKYGSHITVVIIIICMLVGFIVWLDKSPEWIARCAGVAQEQAQNVFSQYASNVQAPPG